MAGECSLAGLLSITVYLSCSSHRHCSHVMHQIVTANLHSVTLGCHRGVTVS